MSESGGQADTGTAAQATETPRFVRIVDDADRLLNQEDEVRNFSQLAEGECWIVSRTIMEPVYVGASQTTTVQLTEQPQSVTFALDARTAQIAQVLQPPNGAIKFHFQEADRYLAFWRLVTSAKRLRNSLAFIAEVPIPLRHVILSRSLMFRFNHGQDLQRYHPEIGTAIHDQAQLRAWYDHLGEAFDATSRLLSQLTLDSPLSRAVSLAGGAVWADDPEDGFLSAWRAVDVIAKLDYSSRTGSEVQLAEDAPETPEVRLSDSRKIRESLSRRVPDIEIALVNRLNELRGRVAHDTVTAELYRSLYEQRWVAFDIANRAIRSCLGEQRIVVPGRRPPLHP